MVVGYLVIAELFWAYIALPLGHLLACFADTFTRQGVQLFWPEPVWCISVSNPRRRLMTGGPGEYWVFGTGGGPAGAGLLDGWQWWRYGAGQPVL